MLVGGCREMVCLMRRTKDGDGPGVAAKLPDVGLDPLQGGHQVSQALM